MTFDVRPMAMGAAMGAMMLWMLHGVLTGTNDLSAKAAIVFVLGHTVALSAIVLLGLWSTRFSAKWQMRLQRLHRPSLRHVGAMVAGALGTAAVIHGVLHSGVSPWT